MFVKLHCFFLENFRRCSTFDAVNTYAICFSKAAVNYTLLFVTVNNTFEKIREVWISYDFLKFICKIALEFRIRNTLLQMFLQTGIIFFNQFKVPIWKMLCGVYDTDNLA